ncbi:MAG: hypothetical protein R3320_05700 [Nitriliruptorales bacterium]|nr:hypothetical protein [Nitriliruptorales bacterium]
MTLVPLSKRPSDDAVSDPGPPFGHLMPPVVLAGLSAVAAIVWIVAGDVLPGGRWVAIHLFTLGVLTPLVATFSLHFGAGVLNADRASTRWVLLGLAGGAAMVLVGLPGGWPWLIAIGATIASVAVFVAYLQLRRMRKGTEQDRFRFVVRGYERAHGAFLHGALLGALLGIGVLPGEWYWGVRLAHLHVNVLGWAGVTLLATLVFFGPTVFRTKIADGAEEGARTAVRVGATAVTVAAAALIATGFGGAAATASRLVAAVAIAAFLAGAVVVVRPVLAASRRAWERSLSTLFIRDAAIWFCLGIAIDVAAVASGTWRWLDPAGLAVLVGGLVTAILGAVTYMAPMVLVVGADPRRRLRERIEAGASTRAWVMRLSVAALVVTAAAGASLGEIGSVTASIGWAGVIGSLVAQVGLVVSGVIGPGSRSRSTR